jgi:hypothetical protein
MRGTPMTINNTPQKSELAIMTTPMIATKKPTLLIPFI